jgi:twitching motility protein PilU
MSGRMEKVLRLMAERQASDVFLSANMPILIKIHGEILQLSDQVLTATQPRQLLSEVLSPLQLEELEDAGELNVAVAVERVGVFRLSAFRQRGSIAGVFRYVPTKVPSLESLNLPPHLGSLALGKRGLVLMVGATGSGKSTTLAAMLEMRNLSLTGHILTIEEPIEYLFQSKKSVVNQREIGRDTQSLQVALRNALRQSPDCILIGEIRDRETMSAALSYAMSGHLVLATMHANNSYHALGRILSFYPPETRPLLLSDLAAGLRAIISQRLLKRAKAGEGLVPAVEVLDNTNLVAEMLEKGDFPGVKDALQRSLVEGSQTFEEDLARLVGEGIVSRDEAMLNADSSTNLLYRLQNEPVQAVRTPPKKEDSDTVVYTDFVIDIVPDAAAVRAPSFPPLTR